MTVAIAYSPGAYGTYLEWCLTTLTSQEKIVAPFLTNGNSHQFIGNILSGCQEFVNLTQSANFARFSPKTTKEESLSKNLTSVCERVSALIHLYPDKNSILLCINNLYSKIYSDWWEHHFTKNYIDSTVIYKNWPIDQNMDIKDIPKWIKREFLSFYLMPAWRNMVEWYHPNIWHHTKCHVVTVGQLLYNFEETLSQIAEFCGLNYVRPISDLADYHKQNLKNQKDLNADNLCNQIINSVIEQTEFHWGEISLINESWIQWQLRNLGYEIQCHELDIFPTNSVHLRELLYTV